MHAVDFYNCAQWDSGCQRRECLLPEFGSPQPDRDQLCGRRIVDAIGFLSRTRGSGYRRIAEDDRPYYDVAYDRSLDPPASTTGTGLAGGPCTPYGVPTGTTTDYDQGIEYDDTKLNGGAPGAGVTDGGIASIDPQKLVRDPAKGCAPVYPWNFVRTNTIFSVVHAAGGYTAWIDKHASYSFAAGPGGTGLDDYYSPEVDSTVVPLPGVTDRGGASCATIRDPTADLSSWTDSFLNIQCYDALKVNALLNEIAGKTHLGAPAQVPALFGMNFQSVYIGQSLNEPGGRGRLPERRGLAQRTVAERDRVCGQLDRRHCQRA
jgi:hypothetical protein